MKAVAGKVLPGWRFNLRHLGPGLIFAGTCIGVSHLVQSTRAGADYGFSLLWAVLLANLFKFPFFEFAPRYAAATGENLLRGYTRVGRWAFYLFLVLTGLTMFPIAAVLTLVTTGLLVNLCQWAYSPIWMAALVLLVCATILNLGKYPVMEKLMKAMIIVLAVSTVVAVAAAAARGYSPRPGSGGVFVWDAAGVWFLVALMGWMPSTIDVSVWHSFWQIEHHKIKANRSEDLKAVLFDFHAGYWGTTVVAVLFLALGALVMHGSGESFSSSAAAFSGQLVALYTRALGPWSFPVIAAAAFVTMFSTTLSCLDAYPRVVREAAVIIRPDMAPRYEQIYLIWMLVTAAAALVIITFFVNSMKTLVDLTTTASFLAAPVFAFINLKTVTCSCVPRAARPSLPLLVFSWLGIIFLTGFSALFVYWRFFQAA